MKYELTQIEINKRCAELFKPSIKGGSFVKVTDMSCWDDVLEVGITNQACVTGYCKECKCCDVIDGCNLWSMYDPCNSSHHAWPIIEQCWEGLHLKYLTDYSIKDKDVYHFLNNGLVKTTWEVLMQCYQCTALEAACIYFIERGKANG